MIGVRDALDGYRQIGELPSFGIGPHEATLMPDGKTLAIAKAGCAPTRTTTGSSSTSTA